MKPIQLFRIILLGLLSVVLFACNSIDDDNNKPGNPENGENNGEESSLQIGEVRIKAYPNDDNKISFVAVADKILIDWGDGTTEEFAPNGGSSKEFIHEYVNQNPQNITIRTEGMKAFGAYTLVSVLEIAQTFGYLEEVRFGECPHLEEVIIRHHDLNLFDMESANSLTLLDCSYNKLSVSALNELFNSLPSVDEGIVIYKENTGSDACDINIVLSKGWTVRGSLPEEDLSIDEIDDESLLAYATSCFTGFGEFLKQVYLIEALYSNTVESENNMLYRYMDLYNHQVNPSNSLVSDLWGQSYAVISPLNRVLDMMRRRTKKDLFSDYIYTAQVLRSYAYFILIDYWGDVPYVDETIYNNMDALMQIKRTDKGQILELLIGQLLEAEAKLPEYEAENVLSKSYARLLLAKIYTYQGNHSKALEYTAKIIESGQFGLSPDYPDIFENSENKEYLTQFLSVYDTNKQWVELIKKGKHSPYARYAEVLLLASENNLRAGNVQEAIRYLNQLRNRNGRSVADMNMSISDIEDFIIEEYKLDMGKEGLCFFALKRFGKAERILEIETFRTLLPIPINEIYMNPNITQNIGYE
ncbi:MAG: RagB/SusD family nutrient uptake outer membrane protein [Tannerella sp.]|jgi:tetratricopeptide (TPR) repeat protein|nr:RagB/SusD family nutrient uptake outer membrane protein [Tannerella sp.]